MRDLDPCRATKVALFRSLGFLFGTSYARRSSLSPFERALALLSISLALAILYRNHVTRSKDTRRRKGRLVIRKYVDLEGRSRRATVEKNGDAPFSRSDASRR